MEGLIKKYQQKFRKVKDEMVRWELLQTRFVSQFRSASGIIERLQGIQDSQNHGALKFIGGISDALLRKQMDSLESLLLSMKKILEEFHSVVSCLEKINQDGKQLAKGGSSKLSTNWLQQRVGVKPCVKDCLDGLALLYDMHHAEYLLKSSLLSALSAAALKSSSDISALQQLLVDQPNIPKEEVQQILDIIFAEEIH